MKNIFLGRIFNKTEKQEITRPNETRNNNENEFVQLTTKLDFSYDSDPVIKLDGKYFKVRELG